MLQSSSSGRKLVKPLKHCSFGSDLHKKGVIMGYAQNETQLFLAEITNLFHQNIKCFGWVMNIFLFRMMLFSQKKSFPAKTAVTVHINYMTFVFRLKQKKVGSRKEVAIHPIFP